jgi:hypothetical protein
MTEDDLRALVRQAVARHLLAESGARGGAEGGAAPGGQVPAPGVHPSFGKYLLPREPGDSGACLIEPSVKCNHCGYCQSHGF